MRKIGIGFKIAFGFGLLIIIIILLGNLAIYNMNQVGKGAALLSNAYIPEVDVAHEIERNAYEAMYHHRAFSYTNDPMELKLGNDALNLVDANTNTAKQLVKRYPQLVKLGQGLAVIEKSLAGYRQQMEKTIQNKRALAGSLIDLEISSEEFNGNINDYLNNQYEKLRYEYRSGATYDAKIKRLRKIVFANKICDIANQVRIDIFKAQTMRNLDMLSGTPAKFNEIDNMLEEADTITLGEDNKERLKKVREAVAQFKSSIDKMSSLAQSDAMIMEERYKFADQLLRASQITATVGVSHTKNISDAAVGDMSQASWILVAGLAVAVILGICISFVITRMVIIPVKVTAKAVSKAARGDFTYRVREKYMQKSDELSQMLRDVQKMTESLSDTVRGVIHSAGVVSNAANEISTGNQDLSQRTQEQASSIEETASSLEEMTASVRTNAENSQQANNLARRTAEMAREGGLAVERTIAAMADVTKSSGKIADIIDVVNEIAFQTNLLALNAAVEAARAGEAGRGFAVVAGEVRNLAGRSANAAKEIQGLITDSREKVELGNDLVTSSGELLGEIIENVQDVADTVAEITAASQEQARGIDEVNKAVVLMDEVIQRNATLVEEAASSSEEMASAAQDLLLQMGQFSIEGGNDVTTGLDMSQGYAPAPAAPKKPETKPAEPKAPKNDSANDDFFNGVDLDGFEEF